MLCCDRISLLRSGVFNLEHSGSHTVTLDLWGLRAAACLWMSLLSHRGAAHCSQSRWIGNGCGYLGQWLTAVTQARAWEVLLKWTPRAAVQSVLCEELEPCVGAAFAGQANTLGTINLWRKFRVLALNSEVREGKHALRRSWSRNLEQAGTPGTHSGLQMAGDNLQSCWIINVNLKEFFAFCCFYCCGEAHEDFFFYITVYLS